jgi:hypothetical protein
LRFNGYGFPVCFIIATVPFWGAMDIFLVEGSERRRTAANIDMLPS